ncbi:type II secretion system protein [Candidatus Microgenomates bacterium]|nr:type II secretion system protein [Candidatus Microgenomates bacterium]
MKNSSSLNKGQTLVEMVVTLAVAVMVISSLVVGVTVSIKNTRFAKNQSLATKYAQEAMEQVRLDRDQDGWIAFWTKVSSIETPGIPNTIFSKQIEYIDESDPDGANNRAKIIVTVSWTEGGREHRSKLTTYLTKWE